MSHSCGRFEKVSTFPVLPKAASWIFGGSSCTFLGHRRSELRIPFQSLSRDGNLRFRMRIRTSLFDRHAGDACSRSIFIPRASISSTLCSIYRYWSKPVAPMLTAYLSRQPGSHGPGRNTAFHNARSPQFFQVLQTSSELTSIPERTSASLASSSFRRSSFHSRDACSFSFLYTNLASSAPALKPCLLMVMSTSR
jgi:hypothetical protein